MTKDKAKPTIPRVFHIGLLGSLLLLPAAVSYARDDIRTERVHFQRGSNSAVVEASIKGYQTVDYLLGASAGQYMNVSLATKHGATYFNLLAPGENEVAMFNGSLSQNKYEGTLPSSGEYKIRVYMMRSAARRNEVAHYRLEMIIEGKGTKAVDATSHDADVPGTDFNATGNIPCAWAKGQPMGSCAIGVKREGDGNATVFITRSDGVKRVIFFKHGRPVGYDKTQADTATLKAEKESDLNFIRIGNERYEIADAFVLGG